MGRGRVSLDHMRASGQKVPCGIHQSIHSARRPPSTAKAGPGPKDASSDSRNATAAATAARYNPSDPEIVEKGRVMLETALDCGYRHLDTAQRYGPEPAVGAALGARIAAGSLRRADVWGTTKVANPRPAFPGSGMAIGGGIDYMLRRDMDAYERRLEAAQNAKKKDMEYIEKSKRKAEQSQNRFQAFSSRLVEDLVLFNGRRCETCGEVVDTFAESLNFTVDREQDVLRLVGGSDK